MMDQTIQKMDQTDPDGSILKKMMIGFVFTKVCLDLYPFGI